MTAQWASTPVPPPPGPIAVVEIRRSITSPTGTGETFDTIGLTVQEIPAAVVPQIITPLIEAFVTLAKQVAR